MSTFCFSEDRPWRKQNCTGAATSNNLLCKMSRPSQSPKYDGQKYCKCVQPHRKLCHAGCTNGKEKLKYDHVPLQRSSVQWVGDRKRSTFKEKNALSIEMKMNKAESSFQKQNLVPTVTGERELCLCCTQLSDGSFLLPMASGLQQN